MLCSRAFTNFPVNENRGSVNNKVINEMYPSAGNIKLFKFNPSIRIKSAMLPATVAEIAKAIGEKNRIA